MLKSPSHLFLNGIHNLYRFKELDLAAAAAAKGPPATATMPKSASHDSSFKIPDVPRPGMLNGESGSGKEIET